MLQEPEIFAEKRVEALAQRNLDTTSRRLMQGLNADFHSGAVGPLSDIHAQATGARLRDAAKKTDQVFFDFDWTDRYFYGLRLGADVFGAHLGVNYTDVFDRIKGRRSRAITSSDTVYFEDNSVLSVEASFDSKELLKNSAFGFGLTGEFGMSSLESSRDYVKNVSEKFYELAEYITKNDVTMDRPDTSFAYIRISETNKATTVNEDLGTVDGTAFYVEPYATIDLAGIEGSLKVMYLQNDEKFWSEMASSPAYRGGATVLNSNALFSDNANYESLIDGFGMSSLENLYMAVYNSNPLYAGNLMTSNSSNALTDKAEKSCEPTV